jgi:hypothetical protein
MMAAVTLPEKGPRFTVMLNLGHPETRSPGVVRAKAHNCSKELFGVMFSDYQLFSPGFVPLLACDEVMLNDLTAMDQSSRRAFISQLNRSRLLDAWDANKRHMRAICRRIGMIFTASGNNCLSNLAVYFNSAEWNTPHKRQLKTTINQHICCCSLHSL